MGSDYCLTSLPSDTHTVRLSWILGCILSGIGYGVLLVVGYGCYVGLRQRNSESGGQSQVKKGLIIYVLFTLILTTTTEIIGIVVTVNSVLDDFCFSRNLQPPNPYLGPFAIPVWLINITTDSLFIWRCYTVCGCLRGQRGWYTLLWVMPLIVYFIMLCTGFVAVVRFAMFRPGEPQVFDVILPVIYSITGFLNILITVCIIIIILRYRRVLAKALGKDHPLPYLNLMVVLVESASLVVVIDGFVVGGYIQGVWGNIAGQVWIPIQPMASFLIIYRVSRGSDYFHQQSEPLTSLRFGQVPESLNHSHHSV